jgi:hypothetical protein
LVKSRASPPQAEPGAPHNVLSNKNREEDEINHLLSLRTTITTNAPRLRATHLRCISKKVPSMLPFLQKKILNPSVHLTFSCVKTTRYHRCSRHFHTLIIIKHIRRHTMRCTRQNSHTRTSPSEHKLTPVHSCQIILTVQATTTYAYIYIRQTDTLQPVSVQLKHVLPHKTHTSVPTAAIATLLLIANHCTCQVLSSSHALPTACPYLGTATCALSRHARYPQE